jgi:hypothetical protein
LVLLVRHLATLWNRAGRAIGGAFITRARSSVETPASPSDVFAGLALKAVERFAAGDLAWADSAARCILVREPERVEMLDLLGRIAARAGYHEDSVRYFDQALSLSPAHATAASARASMEYSPTHPSQQPRYLVIRPWGQGFWSDVSHVMGCLLLAEITGRTPVSHWDQTSLYSDGSESDAFRLYFKPLSAIAIDDLAAGNPTFFPDTWSAGSLRLGQRQQGPNRPRYAGLLYLNRQETVAVSDFYVGVVHLLPWIPRTHPLFSLPITDVYRWLAAKYLHPRDDIMAEVDRLHTALLIGASSIAVHFRGLDKQREYRAVRLDNPVMEDYFDNLDREPASRRIFLLSDDEDVVRAFRARYGERVVCTPFQRSSGHTGLHHQQAREPVRLGREVMIDAYLALRCDKFLGMGLSNVSDMIAMLKPWADGTCTILGPSVLRDIPLHRIKR